MIKVTGQIDTIKAIRKVGIRYVNLMVTAVEMAAQDVQTHAQSDHIRGLAHGLGRYENQSGQLTDDIKVIGPTIKGTKIVAQVVSSKAYAELVEYGGGRRRAYPYMEPAYVANQDAINKRFEQLVIADGLR